MKTTLNLSLLRFLVAVQDKDGQQSGILVTLTKDQLRAAQLCGQSSKELIERLCARQGYTVLDIGKAARKTVVVDLDALWRENAGGAE